MSLPSSRSYYNRWIYPLVALLVAVIGIGTTVYVVRVARENSRSHLIDRANTLAQIITATDIAALNGSEADLENPAYLHIKHTLTSIRSVNRDIRFIYINGIDSHGQLFFYADSENPDSPDYSPPGEAYPEATPLMFDVFTKKQNEFEISSDRWGYWVSAYAPIVDDAGNVVALIGLDTPGAAYMYDLVTHAGLVLLITAIILTLVFAVQYVRKRERRNIDQKTEFLFIASHEIRTPLTGIRWAIESLMTNPTTIEPKARQVLHMVLENAIGLINRINNLLDISAFESKKSVQLRIEPVHIRELVEKAFQSLALTALSRKVQLVIDDSLSSAVVVRCDGERMLHVIVNLLSNAIKYTNSDTEVRVSYAQKADQHIISVADHGGGIGPEDQKHIFDGYHRTASARHSEQYGTGLGLYLCAQIARAHGGSITVASSSHQGTTFSLALPNTLELSER